MKSDQIDVIVDPYFRNCPQIPTKDDLTNSKQINGDDTDPTGYNVFIPLRQQKVHFLRLQTHNIFYGT